MRAILSFSLLAGLLLGALPVRALEPTFPEIKVKVGEAYQLRLGWIMLGVVCDDASLVKIEDGGDHIRLVGAIPGETKCGFWRDYGNPAPAAVYKVVVSGSSKR
jgi:hypothetical protein